MFYINITHSNTFQYLKKKNPLLHLGHVFVKQEGALMPVHQLQELY